MTGNARGRQLGLLLLGNAPLLALYILAPQFSLLHGWHPEAAGAADFMRRALLCLAPFPTLIFLCPPRHRLLAALIYSLAGGIFCLSWPTVLFLASVSAILLFVFAHVANLWGRIGLLLGFFSLAYHLRERITVALPALALFWLFGNFSRFASMPHDAPRKWSARAWAAAFLHINAAPFLVGPRPMGWLSLSYFSSKLNFELTPEKMRAGLWLNAWGFVAIALGSEAFQRLDFFREFIWDYKMLSHTEGGAFNHLAAGFGFFLVRYFQKAGLTALAAGAWHLAGCSIRYDMNKPLLSRNMLDFWGRYLNYGREFFLRTVYMPMAISGARWMPLWLAQLLAFVTVLFVVACYHYFGQLPMPVRIGTATHHLEYTFLGCLKHSFWGGVLMGLTFGFSRLVQAGVAKAEGHRAHAPLFWAGEAAQIAVTLLAIAALFFSSYSQMLMNYPLTTFLRQVLVP